MIIHIVLEIELTNDWHAVIILLDRCISGYINEDEMDDIKSIQLYRRGKTDSLQYAELLAISFVDTIEYISDPLFVKLDVKQLELSISHVVNKKN